MFSYEALPKVYNTCIEDERYGYWCSTDVDTDGKHIFGQEASCSFGCPGVKYEGSKKKKCDTEEQGIQCSIPFSYGGFSYYGCIKRSGDNYFCPVSDEKAERGFRIANCSESCPKDNVLTEVKPSPKEIAETLKTNPIVMSKIDEGEKCEDYMASYNMTKVCKKQEVVFDLFRSDL